MQRLKKSGKKQPSKTEWKMSKLTEKLKALDLRRKGKSLLEIKNILKAEGFEVSKGSLSGWFKEIGLNGIYGKTGRPKKVVPATESKSEEAPVTGVTGEGGTEGA
jgi:arginine repressor